LVAEDRRQPVNVHEDEDEDDDGDEGRWCRRLSPRLCFRVSRASSVPNNVFGKRMKILDLKERKEFKSLVLLPPVD